MALNREHEDFPEFERRWTEIIAESEREITAIEATEKEKKGPPVQDGPLIAVHRKYGLQLAALQREFKHLYE